MDNIDALSRCRARRLKMAKYAFLIQQKLSLQRVLGRKYKYKNLKSVLSTAELQVRCALESHRFICGCGTLVQLFAGLDSAVFQEEKQLTYNNRLT